MIIPWRVDVPQDRWPFTNWLIIVGIVVVFALQVAAFIEQTDEEQSVETLVAEGQADEEQGGEEQAAMGVISQFILNGWGIKGLLGYMWLHGGGIHLLGNLIFLWIFGNAVCAKIGNVIYLPIYVVSGFIAGIAHLIFVDGSVVGASGAINGIVGMYLVFFPENDITCYWIWLFPIVWKRFTVSSYWMILFWLAFDILGATVIGGAGGVAYFAHLGGFAAGFGVAILLLKTKRIEMERYEKSLLQIWTQRKETSQEELGRVYGSFARELGYGGLAETKKDETSEEAKETYQEQAETSELEPEDFFAEQLIRFKCVCGKQVKVAAKYAGKVGRCPRCKRRIQIPERPL